MRKASVCQRFAILDRDWSYELRVRLVVPYVRSADLPNQAKSQQTVTSQTDADTSSEVAVRPLRLIPAGIYPLMTLSWSTGTSQIIV